MNRFTPILTASCLLLAACPKPDEPQQRTTMPQGFPDGGPGPNANWTAAQCEAKGGSVVGDIGDGAIFKPDYTCPSSGKAPLATIEPEPGGPIAVEGSVCCGPAAKE
ncbi:MAG: hypothetical protein ACE37F_17790 [Nannocystaceae bacterium]|nr:hypothetical protein [bacterium]